MKNQIQKPGNILAKKIFSQTEIISLENKDEANSTQNIKSVCSKSSGKGGSISKSSDMNNSQIIESPLDEKDENENEYRSHLIKVEKDDNFVYSYKLKKYEAKEKMIYFECNNKKCKGKGEYDVKKKIFKETYQHNTSMNSHKMATFYLNIKNILMEDKECYGYQILKDFSFIKDKKILLIK